MGKKDNTGCARTGQPTRSRDTLSETEKARLVVLGRLIRAGLDCDANGTGFPCRTDRFSAIEGMMEYLEINGNRVLPGTVFDELGLDVIIAAAERCMARSAASEA